MTEAAVDRRADDEQLSVQHLHARIAVIEERVRSAIARRRAREPSTESPFRGLYIGDDEVDGLLSDARDLTWDAVVGDHWRAVEAWANEWSADGTDLRLRSMARAFGLDETDVELLLIALAPDVDQRFEQFFAYLQNDVTRRRASVGLALELCGLPPDRADARARLAPTGPLIGGGLLVIDDPDRPVLTRSLRVPDRVTSHLLGDTRPPVEIADVLVARAGASGSGPWPVLARALVERISPIYVRQQGMADGMESAAGSVAANQEETLVVDLERLARAALPGQLAAAIVREARLTGAVVIAGPVPPPTMAALEQVAQLAEAPCRVILVGNTPWDPGWSRAVPLSLDVPQPDVAERLSRWQTAFDGGVAAADVQDLERATLAFRLGATQQARATTAGRLRATAEGRALRPSDLQAGARDQNAAGLERLAYRITPTAGWADLVVQPEVQTQLLELAARARQRERVLDDWQVGGRASRGRGITGLFSGESGTGKTLAAEVVAGDLGLDLYVIDLSTVVDKYIGETEKNLDRIFSEADRVNGVLLFDEADAIFGKRSDVRDARDRYANVEVAYLLQRMERFDGLAILTTNLRANLDEAFTRRIDAIVDFGTPNEGQRLALWRMHLPPELPQSLDIDLEFLARRFKFPGGIIRNACLTAAFLAADSGQAVTMLDLIRGTEREYRKLGHLAVEAEFGPYLELARPAR